MFQRLRQKRSEEGFTLIALLIVIIVLGILAAIVVFAVGTTRKDSVAAACKTSYKSAELSAEAGEHQGRFLPLCPSWPRPTFQRCAAQVLAEQH